MARSIGSVYAKALADALPDRAALKKAMDEAETLRQVFLSDSELFSFYCHPKISREEKEKALQAPLSGIVSKELLGLLSVLTEKKRGADLLTVLDRFREEAMERLRMSEVTVSSARPLNDDQKRKIEDRLRETAPDRTLSFTYLLDESLIGGVKIRVGDRVVDGTVKNKLSRIRRDLLNARIDL